MNERDMEKLVNAYSKLVKDLTEQVELYKQKTDTQDRLIATYETEDIIRRITCKK